MSSKHVVFGSGNLGMDIVDELKKAGIDGLHYPSRTSLQGVGFDPDCTLWYCLGGISVNEAKLDPSGSADALVTWPLEFARKARRSIFFSSDYAREPDRSLYARLQLAKELLLETVPGASVVRVTNLYGMHHPERTLPGKLLINQPRILPSQYVAPTPTDWLAKILVQRELSSGIPRFASSLPEDIDLLDFAKLALGYKPSLSSEDTERPINFNSHWDRHLIREYECVLGNKSLAIYPSELWADRAEEFKSRLRSTLAAQASPQPSLLSGLRSEFPYSPDPRPDLP